MKQDGYRRISVGTTTPEFGLRSPLNGRGVSFCMIDPQGFLEYNGAVIADKTLSICFYSSPPIRKDSMASPLNLKQILREYRQRLLEILGADLDSVLLYGSQARHEASAGSDIDVLCIMTNPFDHGDLNSRTSLATAEISLKYDVVISRVFVTREAYASQDSPFLMNVRKEQVAV